MLYRNPEDIRTPSLERPGPVRLARSVVLDPGEWQHCAIAHARAMGDDVEHAVFCQDGRIYFRHFGQLLMMEIQAVSDPFGPSRLLNPRRWLNISGRLTISSRRAAQDLIMGECIGWEAGHGRS